MFHKINRQLMQTLDKGMIKQRSLRSKYVSISAGFCLAAGAFGAAQSSCLTEASVPRIEDFSEAVVVAGHTGMLQSGAEVLKPIMKGKRGHVEKSFYDSLYLPEFRLLRQCVPQYHGVVRLQHRNGDLQGTCTSNFMFAYL
jgi:hypothetical protein